MYLIPVQGRRVPDPEMGGELLPEGREKTLTQYWLRRIEDGDVIEGAAPVEAGPVKSAAGESAAASPEA